jgi:hypothetical protein
VFMLFRSDSTEGQESGEKEALQVPVEEIRDEWHLLWRNRIDDKVRAEGIANKDYSLLYVDRGTVIVATRDYKPLSFKEILRSHGVGNGERFESPPSSVGGYTKFARTVLNKHKRFRRCRASEYVKEHKDNEKQQRKKGGRGWLHYSLNK